ncbi:MAG: FmdB family zinc ribbon protein [Frankia sp.]
MPRYEYRCRTCDSSFEVRRDISEPAPATTSCPSGHDDTNRVFSAIAVNRGAAAGPSAPMPASVPSGGGGGACCGGGCCG